MSYKQLKIEEWINNYYEKYDYNEFLENYKKTHPNSITKYNNPFFLVLWVDKFLNAYYLPGKKVISLPQHTIKDLVTELGRQIGLFLRNTDYIYENLYNDYYSK